MDFRNNRNELIESEKREIHAYDTYDVSANCPGQCNSGRIGLKEKISSMIQNKETQSFARAQCAHPSLTNPFEACGTRLECRIEIKQSEQ